MVTANNSKVSKVRSASDVRGATPQRSFMSQLARDVRGNTLAIMAAAMIPILGFAGSAVDTARLYFVKVRLQQACDAGVLAGRKTMTDTAPGTPLDAKADKQAKAFFKNNFREGLYQTTAPNFTPIKSIDGNTSTVANAVSGTATVMTPMAVMQFFGIQPVQISVTCQARFDVGDADIMFVLDTTGSMSCRPSDSPDCSGSIVPYRRDDGSSGYHARETGNSGSEMSKIEALRQSVVLFDTTMRANADSTAHFRYGFVPYSSSVNIGNDGKIVSSQYLQKNWTYQSRHLSPVNSGGGGTNNSSLPGDYAYGSPSSFTATYLPQYICQEQRYPATGFSKTGPGLNGFTWSTSYYQAARFYNLSWTAANGGTCTGTQQPLRALWRYEPVALNTAPFLTSTVSAPIANPSRLDGVTTFWRGCVEELNTSATASFSVSSLPADLNPDIKPSDPANLWRPLWSDVEWLRNPGTTSQDVQDDSVDEIRPFSKDPNTPHPYSDYSYRTDSYLDQGGSASCGMPAQRLRSMSAAEVRSYVYDNDFQPFGGTYHDVGMIWGTRMMSPDGMFAGDTAAWPNRNAPSRNIVFMTDGEMKPSLTSYGQYGVEYLDNRVDGGSSNWGSDKDRHNARFRIECDVAKTKGFTIYVIALGTDLNSDLTYCASPGRGYYANNPDKLKLAFKSIAEQIAMLRIIK